MNDHRHGSITVQPPRNDYGSGVYFPAPTLAVSAPALLCFQAVCLRDGWLEGRCGEGKRPTEEIARCLICCSSDVVRTSSAA